MRSSPPPKPAGHQTAFTALQAGRHDESERLLRRLLRANADDAIALHGLGLVLMQTARHHQALGFFDRAERAGDSSSLLHGNRATCLSAQGFYDAAIVSLDHALRQAPQDGVLHFNRGNALMQLRRDDAALDAFDAAVQFAPTLAQAWQNRATVLTRLGRVENALTAYDRAVALSPNDAELYANRAGVLDFLGARAAALRDADRALALAPGNGLAHWNAALICLAQGDYARGFAEFEWRFDADNARWLDNAASMRRPNFDKPLWLGQENIAGKTLLVYPEQGLGDTLQFCRYVTLAADRGASVVLMVQPPLVRLLRTLAGTTTVIAQGDAVGAFDFHTPMMSLPHAFGTQLQSVPARTPYLAADPARTAVFAQHLGPRTQFRVGLAWSGNPALKNNAVRSAALNDLAGLILSGVTYVSVQKDIPQADRDAAQRLGVLDLSDLIEDFADTAALMQNLDLVISVDSSPAHLAGALGMPVWILLYHTAEWRWLMDRADSPWYPSARLFRQTTPRDWHRVAATVGAALDKQKSERA